METVSSTHACDNLLLFAFPVVNAYRSCGESPKARKLLKLAMSGRFILASAPIRPIDASLKVIGGRFYVDGREGGRKSITLERYRVRGNANLMRIKSSGRLLSRTDRMQNSHDDARWTTRPIARPLRSDRTACDYVPTSSPHVSFPDRVQCAYAVAVAPHRIAPC